MKAGADRLRPRWATLSSSVRDRIVETIGGRFLSDAPTHGGFSAAYAGVVTTTAGRAFVKACAADGHADSHHFIREEIRVLLQLPPAIGPRVVASIDDAAGVALVLEAIDGRHPGNPWRPDDLHAIAETLRIVATTPAPDTLARAEDTMIPDYTRWKDISLDVRLREGLPHALQERMPDLLRLEATFGDTIHGDVIVHDDVRADNILIHHGRAHLLDWPHARRGAPWVDLPHLLPSIEAAGGPRCEDAWVVFQEHGAPSQESLLAVASAFASYLWYAQAQPEIPQLPGLRAFQRAQAVPALRWLSALLSRDQDRAASR